MHKTYLQQARHPGTPSVPARRRLPGHVPTFLLHMSSHVGGVGKQDTLTVSVKKTRRGALIIDNRAPPVTLRNANEGLELSIVFFILG
jgi:hypothetical protein